MNRHVLLVFVCLCGMFTLEAVAFNHDESANGDLSSVGANPTTLSLDSGPNVLIGATGNGDYDFFTFEVGASQQLDQIILDNFANQFGVSFIGIQSGTAWTAGVDFAIDPSLLLGWAHFGNNLKGTDILDNIGQGFGAIGFTPPLGPGNYTFLLQDTDGTSPYGFTFMASGGGLVGDFDGNGLYECPDVDALVGEIVFAAGGGTPDLLYDLTQDGLVDQNDLTEWRTVAGAVLTASGNPIQVGDANLDGSVDGSDFGIWNSAKFTQTPEWCSGDVNADGSVDGSDFGLWNANKFQSADGMSVVPEPGAIVGSLLAGLWLVIRSRRLRI